MKLKFVVSRVLQAVVVLWSAYTLTYIILNLLPADPLTIYLDAQGQDAASLSSAQLNEYRTSLGLNGNAIQRYFSMLAATLHGNLGVSYTFHQPVATLIKQHLASTLLISVVAIIISVVFSLIIAFFATYVRIGWLRFIISAIPSLESSVPSFWIGLILMQIFSFGLGWFPAMGEQGWKSLILPSITMSVPTAAMLSQVLMRGFEEELDKPYMATARAKGLTRWYAQLRHALKNAVLPSLTLLGLFLGNIVTGAIVSETIYTRQGIGMLIQQSVQSQDIPVVQGIVILGCVAFVVINLAVDLVYPLFDPRADISRY